MNARRKCDRCGAALFGKKGHGFVEGFVKNKNVGVVVCGDPEECEKRARRGRTR